MKKLRLICAFASLACLFLSCKQVTETSPEENSLPASFSFKYENLGVLPRNHNQSKMVVYFSDKILVYGNNEFLLYDIVLKSWQTTIIPSDSISGRWDGAIGYIGNAVYVFGSPLYMEGPKHYNVMKLDPATLSLAELPTPLPIQSYHPYPAYETYDDKILIIFPGLDSVYLFNSSSQKSRYVAKNELKVPETELFHGPLYAFGGYNGSLYIYNKLTQELASINLYTFVWNKIEIPVKVKEIISNYWNGGVFDDILVLWSGRASKSLCYDIKNNVWGYGNCDIYSLMFLETGCKNFTQFYFINSPMDTLWRVTHIK